jgi:hypothetical protein
MNMDMSDLSAELDKLGKRLDEITQKFKLQSTVQDENIKKLAELKDAQARTEAAQRQSVIISISSIAVAVVALMVSIFL